MKVQKIRMLSQEAKMLIRQRAVLCVVEQKKSWEETIEIFGIGRSSLGKWLKAYKIHGESGLKIKNKVGRPAKTISKLKPWQCASITRMITDKTPNQLKMPFMLWNINSVKELITDKFNTKLSTPTISRYLKKWSFTPQRPLTKSFAKELSKNLRSYLYTFQRNKQKIRNFFKKECMRYAA